MWDVRMLVVVTALQLLGAPAPLEQNGFLRAAECAVVLAVVGGKL